MLDIEKTNKVNMRPKMPDKKYFVRWECDIWASDPEAAAKKAVEMIADPNSIAHVFDVDDIRIDLDEIAESG